MWPLKQERFDVNPPVFFTIVSRNYLAYALTLMQSVAACHPDSKRYLCLADTAEDDPALDTDLFETVTIDQLGLPDFDAFVFRYDIMELNTAVKPYMFAWLRVRHPEGGLIYLDPDILVLRPLDAVVNAFRCGSLAVLTPHINAPLPDDGMFPTELSLMRSGVYNCGFVAINAAHARSGALIEWWSRKLEFDCFVDLESGLFTDQKWMDMAPGMFPDVTILRDDGYNVAYWNLVSRPVTRSANGGYLAAGVPLVFVHFSGVDLRQPQIFSKHQNRFDANSIGGLRPLYDDYLDTLRSNGQLQHASKPYAYACFADGRQIVRVLRRVYHRSFDTCCERPEPHPFLMSPAPFNELSRDLTNIDGLPVTRVMHETWRMRKDLVEAFNLRTLGGREQFIRWFLMHAKTAMGLDDVYLDAVKARFHPPRALALTPARGWRARTARGVLRILQWGAGHDGLARTYARIPLRWRLALRRRVHATSGMPMPPLPPASGTGGARVKRVHRSLRAPGVNLVGYTRGEFGIAENVRSYARALEQAGYPFGMFNFDVGVASRQDDHSMDGHVAHALTYVSNVFFINADQMPLAFHELGQQALAGHRNIGFWVWELEHFPADWHRSFDLIDEVWVPTDYVRRAISACTSTKTVLRMPKAIDFDVPIGLGRSHFGLPDDEFVFLFSYDFNSFSQRKNPEAAIAAFRRAFSGDPRHVRLLVKSINGDRFPSQLDAVRRSVAHDPRIEVRDGFLSRSEMFALEGSVDCYVSLHRAEGFGLGMAESMYLGKPVIATGYSGNLDFMDATNSLLVDYKLVPVRDGEYPYWQGQRWADPDVDHAARLMRQVVDDAGFAQRIGAVASASIRRSNSRATCARAVIARLTEIHEKAAAV